MGRTRQAARRAIRSLILRAGLHGAFWCQADSGLLSVRPGDLDIDPFTLYCGMQGIFTSGCWDNPATPR